MNGSPTAGRRVENPHLPDGVRLISVLRDGGEAEIAVGSTVLEVGDQVLAILQLGNEDERKVLLR
jgi:Trk K+ transport system NAD-binding subunit